MAALFPLWTHAEAADDVARQNQLLLKMMKNPSNYDVTFEYVRVSVALKDYEAAIGALERLLFYNPALTRAKYELGALYYKLGSFDLATQYFKDALASRDIDAETKSRIAAYLPSAEKELSPSRGSFFAETGVSYQSNASATPNGNLSPPGFPIDLSGPHGADWNWFILGQFAHDFDFGDQAGNRLETRATGYLSEQFKLSALDVALFEASVGPRFFLAPDAWPGLSIKPYAVGGVTWVGGSEYFADAGGGASLDVPLGKAVTVTSSVDWRRAGYQTDSTASFGTADWVTETLSATVRFNDAFSLDANASHRRVDADLGWQSYEAYAAQVAFSLHFDPPSERIAQKWTLSLFGLMTWTDFDQPNPAVLSVARSDDSWQVGLLLNAPITKCLGLSALIAYEQNNSNIPNYVYDNWSFVVGPTARF